MAIKHGSKVDKSYSAASMTDLMFLLLMFMLIATTLINPNALKLLLPKSASPNKEHALVTISITPDLQYYLDKQVVSLDMLGSALQAKMAGAPDATISLHCDETVPMGDAMEVMNVIRDSGYVFVLATRPK